jgi:hypothetical protein
MGSQITLTTPDLHHPEGVRLTDRLPHPVELAGDETAEPGGEGRRRPVVGPVAGDAGRVITVAGVVERGLHKVDEGQEVPGPHPFPQVLPQRPCHGGRFLLTVSRRSKPTPYGLRGAQRRGWRFLVIVATPELFGSCDGSRSAGSGTTDDEA